MVMLGGSGFSTENLNISKYQNKKSIASFKVHGTASVAFTHLEHQWLQDHSPHDYG